jgi:hypothetical protein
MNLTFSIDDKFEMSLMSIQKHFLKDYQLVKKNTE